MWLNYDELTCGYLVVFAFSFNQQIRRLGINGDDSSFLDLFF